VLASRKDQGEGKTMARIRQPKDKITTAAQQVSAEDTQQKPERINVTLFLEKEPYKRLQEIHGRAVSQVISRLIKAYLAAKQSEDQKASE
jgi:hypothetical protein